MCRPRTGAAKEATGPSAQSPSPPKPEEEPWVPESPVKSVGEPWTLDSPAKVVVGQPWALETPLECPLNLSTPARTLLQETPEVAEEVLPTEVRLTFDSHLGLRPKTANITGTVL